MGVRLLPVLKNKNNSVEQVVTHQPAISFSISIHFPFNRAGGRTSNVLPDDSTHHKRADLLRTCKDAAQRSVGVLVVADDVSSLVSPDSDRLAATRAVEDGHVSRPNKAAGDRRLGCRSFVVGILHGDREISETRAAAVASQRSVRQKIRKNQIL